MSTLTQNITFGTEQSFYLRTYSSGSLGGNTVKVNYTLSVSKCIATLSLTVNESDPYLSGANIILSFRRNGSTEAVTIILSSTSATTKTFSWYFDSSYAYIEFISCLYTQETAIVTASRMVFTTTSDTSSIGYYDNIRSNFVYSNTAPTVTITVPELTNGHESRISWTTSDVDGDTVYAYKLVRYTKVVDATKYTSKTLFSNSSESNTYYDDTIPDDAGGGSVYYVLTVMDDYDMTTVISNIVTVTSVEINSIAIHPTGYIDNDYAYSSAENIENGYTTEDSSTYATINLAKGKRAETYIYYTFDLSSIPKNATILSVSCSVKAYISSTSISSIHSRTMQLYSGTTAKGSSANIPKGATITTISTGDWTRDELTDCRLKLYAQRGNSGTTTAINIKFYGATLTIRYGVPVTIPIIGNVTINGVDKELTTAYVCIDGVWKETSASYVCIDGVWK